MNARYWVEFRGSKKVALFVVAIVALAAFWQTTVQPVLDDLLRTHGSLSISRAARRVASSSIVMCVTWIAGWFLALFVRAEDQHVVAPFDFQAVVRLIGGFFVMCALAIAAFFAFLH
jgi:hypothetical protein